MNNAKSKKDEKSFNSFDCNVCERTFKYNSQLTTHKRTHTEEKPYKCEMCVKRFKSEYYLIVHKRVHTGKNHTNVKIAIKVLLKKVI